MKKTLRTQMHKVRARISPNRRKSAQKSIYPSLEQYTQNSLVLSYVAFGTELCLSELNQRLATQNRLVLPRVEEEELALYAVFDLKKQLMLSKWNIWEPNPSQCQKISYKDIHTILLPGLAFDPSHNRLGYGKGFYDRLLQKTPHAETIGVGFKEQKVEYVPINSWDQSTQNLVLG